MLLAIAVNSQYSNMKNRLLRQQMIFESQLARSKLPIKIPTLRDNIAKWRANEQPVSLKLPSIYRVNIAVYF